jgi:N-acetylmuramoyl-L-alanine amidase
VQIASLPSWLEHRDRKQGTTCTTILLHATATPSLQTALDVLRERELSYHFLIDKDGSVLQCVPTDKVAFHAGESVGPDGPGVNEYSIGVSLVNLNDGDEPYTAQQIQATEALVRHLVPAFPTLRFLTTHAIVSPGRKSDPVGYPVAALAQATGLELWQ